MKTWLEKTIPNWIPLLIATSLLIAFMLFFNCVSVRGSSMFPGLQNGDLCLAFKSNNAQRGDMITFWHPIKDIKLVKRVIGLPGETIVIHNTTIFITTKQGKSLFLKELYLPYETLMENGEWKLDNNSVFVLGDNRDYSLDSRLLGPISIESIEGILWFRLINFCNSN